MQTVDGLFGPIEIAAPKPRCIKFRMIKAVYETMMVNDNVTDYLTPNARYTSPSQIFETFSFLRNETKESFCTAHPDGKNRIVCLEIVSVGTLNQAIVTPRDTFKTALLSNAAALILVHNHPTGDPSPSSEDLEVTRRLREAGELLGIKVLDHIIVGDSYYSFVERGVI
jgi:DNA repair protein RadC